jgi:TolA-binding protein
MPETKPPSTLLLRTAAVAVLSLSMTACTLQVLELSAFSLATLIQPLLTFIAGIALAAIVDGIAQLVAAPTPASNDSSASFQELIAAVNHLHANLPGLMAQAIEPLTPAPAETLTEYAESYPAEPAAAYADSTGEFTDGTTGDYADSPADSASGPAPTLPVSNIEVQLEKMVRLLEEMKEVSMLDESQRQTRRLQQQQRRKTSRLEEAARLINQQDWQEADALLHLLESLHPGDSDVLACRNQLDDSRISAQTEHWDALQKQVADLLALSRYSEAVTACQQFLEHFPTHTDAQRLTQRIKQEQQIYTENAATRLYDEIKSAVENRKWRGALDGIQSFLERFPDHPRANKIRQQVRVIQKNAEIEERHEQEERIRQLINARQYTDAADLSEDLLQRFPDSPQAAYLSELLPKLRERSSVAEEDVISS